jgi:predicted dehydrogenase
MPGIAFAGAGRVAELHRDALAGIQDATLTGVYDPNKALRTERAQTWGVRAYSTLDELLADHAVQAVYVLSPAETHLEVALACLRQGRHVLVEKPVSFFASDIDTLVAASRAAGLLAIPGHNYAYIPEFQRIARLARGGDLGRIRALWVTYAIAHPEAVASAYDGVLKEVMVHHAYLTLALLGAPSRIVAGVAEPSWQRHPAEDQAWMTWEYERRTTAHLFASFAVDDESADPWTFVVKVLGERGSASMTWRNAFVRRPKGSLSIGLPTYEESYEHETRAFLAAISGEATPVSSLEDAAVVARIIDAAYESARLGTAVERFPEGGGDSRW